MGDIFLLSFSGVVVSRAVKKIPEAFQLPRERERIRLLSFLFKKNIYIYI